jgi:hypothetical protein
MEDLFARPQVPRHGGLPDLMEEASDRGRRSERAVGEQDEAPYGLAFFLFLVVILVIVRLELI